MGQGGFDLALTIRGRLGNEIKCYFPDVKDQYRRGRDKMRGGTAQARDQFELKAGSFEKVVQTRRQFPALLFAIGRSGAAWLSWIFAISDRMSLSIQFMSCFYSIISLKSSDVKLGRLMSIRSGSSVYSVHADFSSSFFFMSCPPGPFFCHYCHFYKSTLTVLGEGEPLTDCLLDFRNELLR